MAVKRILIRRDTTENWNSTNATLLYNGELGIEICGDGSRKLKIGDGFTTWPELAYAIDDEKYTDVLNAINEKDLEQDNTLSVIEEILTNTTNSVSGINDTIALQENKITEIIEKNENQDNRLDGLEEQDTLQDAAFTELENRVNTLENTPVSDAILNAIEAKNTEQDERLEAIEDDNYSINQKITTIENTNNTQTNLLDSLTSSLQTLQNDVLSVNTSQSNYDTKFQSLENKDSEQDGRLNAIESNLNNQQNGEIANINNLIDNLSDTLNTEITGRTQNDLSHNTSITDLYNISTQEQIDRIDADNTLQDNINILEINLNTEIEDRENADSLLQDAVDTITSNLATEVQDREDADLLLRGDINLLNSDLGTETQEREDADTSLQNQISDNLTSFQNHESDVSNPHSVTKAQVGLGNADDTSDLDKPVSTAQQTAISAALSSSIEYTDDRIEAVVNGTLHYLGDVDTYDDLPTENNVFDLWHVLDTGKGYYWFGEDWNLLDFSVDLSKYYEKTETNDLLNDKVDKVSGKALSSNDFTDERLQMLQALAGDLKVFHDSIEHTSDVYEDILVTRYMLKSDLTVTNSSMQVAFDGLIFRAVATSASNLRTEVAAASGTVLATVRRNSFWNSGVEGQTAQKVSYTTTPQVIDATIYVDSNDYSIYQIFVNNHWWEINLWPADTKSAVLMSIERRL
jgi:hypothetical protein